MDQNLVYAKTPSGDEAVRQSTRVVQRNLRMVLVQVDGKLSVAELAAKIGNAKVVESALRDLEEGGFIAPTLEAASIWEEGKRRVQQIKVSATSQFSGFGSKSVSPAVPPERPVSAFSTFGKPILPTTDKLVDEPPPPLIEEKERVRVGRPFKMKSLFAAFGLLVFLLLATAFFFPYDRFRPEIEAALGKSLGGTVRVGAIHVGFLPRPSLLVTDIRLGANGEGSIEQMRLPSPLALLVSGSSSLNSLELAGVKLSADFLAGMSALSVPPSLQRVGIERMSIAVQGVSIHDLSGEILFQGNGKVDKASINTVDRSLRLVVTPTPQGALLNIEGFGWRPLGESSPAFDALQAKGLLQHGKLVIQNFDSTFMGGVMKGSWLLDWSNGLTMAGDANLSRLDTMRLAALFVPALKLEGDLAGNLRLRSSASEWPTLWRNVEATLDAELTRGVFHGIDLGEVARRGGGYVVRSGSTRFATLRAEVNLDPGQFAARNLQLDAGIMTARGQLVCLRDLSVQGDFVVGMQSSVNTLRVPVKLSGKLGELVAVSGR